MTRTRELLRTRHTVAAGALVIGLLATTASPAGAGGVVTPVAPSTTLTAPEHQSQLSHLSSINLMAFFGGNPIAGVQVSLKKKMDDGTCRSFNGTRFVRRGCSKTKWLAAEQGLLNQWHYDLPSLLVRPSDANSDIKHYIASSRAFDTVGLHETAFENGRNVSRFDILGGP